MVQLRGVWPKPDNRWLKLIRDVYDDCRHVWQKIKHLYEWELDYVKMRGDYEVPVWECNQCLGVLPEDTKYAWRWNPFVAWH